MRSIKQKKAKNDGPKGSLSQRQLPFGESQIATCLRERGNRRTWHQRSERGPDTGPTFTDVGPSRRASMG